MLLGVLPWWAVVVSSPSVCISVGRPCGAAGPLALVGLAYPIAVFVAVFRYHLFDLEWVMRKSLLYGALTTALVLLFYGALGAGGALFARAFEGGRESVWVVSAATLLLGLLFNPLRNRLERSSTGVSFRSARRFASASSRWSRSCRRAASCRAWASTSATSSAGSSTSSRRRSGLRPRRWASS